MANPKKRPVEVASYRNVFIPTYDPASGSVSEKWWSVKNDMHSDDDYLPWDAERGSEIPPF